MPKLKYIYIVILIMMVSVGLAYAQRRSPSRPAVKPKTVVFAVLNDGKTIEPIGYVDRGKMSQAIDNSSESQFITGFHKSYYKAKTSYRLIFGGATAGSVVVNASDASAECSASMAEVLTSSKRAKLKGFVMGLATNMADSRTASGMRRLPTPAERKQAEDIVRRLLTDNKVADAASKALKYHNLTAVDIDSDEVAELVGSYWVETGAKSRTLVFFIAGKAPNGEYAVGYSDVRSVREDEVMNDDIKTVDSGIYNELFLDLLDIDGDGSSEIFTTTEGFEGRGFNAYSRNGEKWEIVYEGSNYRCAF